MNFQYILILLLPLLVFSSILQDKKNITGPLYDFQGDCTEINKKLPHLLCLSYYPVTFDDLFKEKYADLKIQESNEWFSLNPYFGDKKLYVKKTSEGKIGVFSKQNISIETIIYKFNFYDMITPFSLTELMKNSSKTEQLEKLPPLNFTKASECQLIYSLLLHLYWNNYSYFKALMRFFPEKVDIPLFTLTPYEIELLKGDDAYEKLLMLRKGAVESQIYFENEINKKWSEEQIEIFSRHEKIPVEDFNYALMLFYKFAWEENEYEATKKPPHFYIPLGLHLFGKRIYEDKISYRRQMEESKEDPNDKHIKRLLLAVKEIHEDDELLLNTGVLENTVQINHDWEYFLLKSYIPEDNDKDCIDLYIMEKTTAESYGAPTQTCFNLHNKRIIAIHATGNLINMNDAQYEACKKIVDTRDNRAKMHQHEDEKVFVFEKCVHPKWTKFDIWEQPLEELEKKIKLYTKKYNKSKKYAKLRKAAKVNDLNAILLEKYFSRKLKLCKDLKANIIKIMENPKLFYRNLKNN